MKTLIIALLLIGIITPCFADEPVWITCYRPLTWQLVPGKLWRGKPYYDLLPDPNYTIGTNGKCSATDTLTIIQPEKKTK